MLIVTPTRGGYMLLRGQDEPSDFRRCMGRVGHDIFLELRRYVWRDEQDLGRVRGVEGYASLVDQHRVG
jgi:hypothetical protein